MTELVKSLITPTIKTKIENIVTVFENGGFVEPNYGLLKVYQDGRKVRGIKTFQITYGVRQTTEQGSLADLIELYCATIGAKYASELRKFLPQIGVKPLYSNGAFKRLLIAAGDDTVMKKCQDVFFENTYWKPAKNWFDVYGFTLPLSMLVIYDSQIHSGGILQFLRNRFKEMPPKFGGNEKEWVTEYVKTRDEWLEFNDDKTLRITDYRTDCFLEQIRIGNWMLTEKVKILYENGSIATVP